MCFDSSISPSSSAPATRSAGQINGGFNKREDEARDAISVVLNVGDLDAVDSFFDLRLGEDDAGSVEQAAKSNARGKKASLVVPERIVAVEGNKLERTPRHDSFIARGVQTTTDRTCNSGAARARSPSTRTRTCPGQRQRIEEQPPGDFIAHRHARTRMELTPLVYFPT